MANLLSQPALWENDGGQSPPGYWDGVQYALESPPGTGMSFAIHHHDDSSGATVSGCITQSNDNGDNLYLILGHTGDSEWYGPFDSVYLPHGQRVEFSFTVPSGFHDRLTLLVGADPQYMYSSYAYGLNVHIDPGCLDLVAEDDNATTRSGTPVTTNVLANDTLGGKPVTLAQLSGIPIITVQPKNGTVTVNADGTITYKPNPGFSGEDSYEYGIQLPTDSAGY